MSQVPLGANVGTAAGTRLDPSRGPSTCLTSAMPPSESPGGAD